MLLQVAIDRSADLALIPELADVADIVEVGTRVIKERGIGVLAQVRAVAPGVLLLADMKTADGGTLETEMAAEAGADLTTVLAHASPNTLAAVVRSAQEHGLGVMVDTLGDDDIWCRPAVRRVADVALLALHSPNDAGLATDWRAPADAARSAGFRLTVAGRIGPAQLDRVADVGAEVVVGAAITRSPDPREAAVSIRARLPRPGHGWLGTGRSRS